MSKMLRYLVWICAGMALLLLVACASEEGSAGASTLSEPGAATITPALETTATLSATAALSPTTTLTATSAPTPTSAAPTPTADINYSEPAGGGGGKNVVRINNKTDGKLSIKANIQLNRAPGPNVQTVNLAFAYASCTDCQTIAVALQINLIGRDTRVAIPQNAAVAVNAACTRCVTVARALQYTYSVDDPTQVPREVAELLRALDHELKAIHADHSLTLAQAEERLGAVIAQFKELAPSLSDQRDEATEGDMPDATPYDALPAEPPTATLGPSSTSVPPASTTPPASSTVAPAATQPVPTPSSTAKPTATDEPTPTAGG
jgi:putative peptide zinc metalloprotease protein